MKHDRIDPCNFCPFRKGSAQGWLGTYTPELILSHIMGETPFPCHITVDYENPNWRETLFTADTKVQACAGFLIMQRKFAKLSRDTLTACHSMRLDRNHPDVMSWAEFVEHHERKPK